jgi:hypothetical protein
VPELGTNLSPVSELAIDLRRDRRDALHRQIEASIRQRILIITTGRHPVTRVLTSESSQGAFDTNLARFAVTGAGILSPPGNRHPSGITGGCAHPGFATAKHKAARVASTGKAGRPLAAVIAPSGYTKCARRTDLRCYNARYDKGALVSCIRCLSQPGPRRVGLP